jgi:hypothetical protein
MGKLRLLGNVYEPEFVPVTMKIRDFVNIQEDSRPRASLEAQRGRDVFLPF